ncbi:MAG: hypothetical protein OEY28_03430 [Nitrospira sp.]|nr:hypothetical protein [Nitrospira sp.]
MRIGTRELVRTDYLSAVKDMPTVFLSGISNGSVGSSDLTRRQEIRVVEQRICAYELCESIDEEKVVIQQGEAYSLNRSEHGILLFMGYRPRHEQLLEVRIPESRWRRSLNLYEVQWTKPVYAEPGDQLFLVGCRLAFGPSRYWAL